MFIIIRFTFFFCNDYIDYEFMNSFNSLIWNPLQLAFLIWVLCIIEDRVVTCWPLTVNCLAFSGWISHWQSYHISDFYHVIRNVRKFHHGSCNDWRGVADYKTRNRTDGQTNVKADSVITLSIYNVLFKQVTLTAQVV